MKKGDKFKENNQNFRGKFHQRPARMVPLSQFPIASGRAPPAVWGRGWGGRLAPQGGEHGDDLLFPGHDPGQEHRIVLGLLGEGLGDGVVVTDVQKLGAFQ